MTTFFQGIRKRIWDSADKLNPRDVAEGFRDVDEQLRRIYRRSIKTGSWTYDPPFYLELPNGANPTGVLLVSIKLYQQPASVVDVSSVVAFEFVAPRIKVIGIAGPGIVIGQKYDMTFEVIG